MNKSESPLLLFIIITNHIVYSTVYYDLLVYLNLILIGWLIYQQYCILNWSLKGSFSHIYPGSLKFIVIHILTSMDLSCNHIFLHIKETNKTQNWRKELRFEVMSLSDKIKVVGPKGVIFRDLFLMNDFFFFIMWFLLNKLYRFLFLLCKMSTYTSF